MLSGGWFSRGHRGWLADGLRQQASASHRTSTRYKCVGLWRPHHTTHLVPPAAAREWPRSRSRTLGSRRGARERHLEVQSRLQSVLALVCVSSRCGLDGARLRWPCAAADIQIVAQRHVAARTWFLLKPTDYPSHKGLFISPCVACDHVTSSGPVPVMVPGSDAARSRLVTTREKQKVSRMPW